MVIRLSEGDLLEIYRRYPGSRSWSSAQALAFLRQFSRSELAMLTMRRHLRGASNRNLLERFAHQVSAGNIILVWHRGTDRLPGVSVVLQSPSESIVFLPKNRLNPQRDLSPALQWLLSVSDEADEMSKIRNLLSSTVAGQSYDAVERERFKGDVERLLLCGELVPIWHERSRYVSDPGDPPVIAPAPVQRSSQPAAVEEASTFPSNIDAAAIAAGLQAAAEIGVPFCEECLRRAAAAS